MSFHSDFYVLRAAAFLLILFLWVPTDIVGQSSASSLKRQGDYYFEQGDYRSALRNYRQGGLDNSKDKKLRLKIGICLYEIHDVDGAIRVFQSLIQEGKTESVVFYHIAKCYQSKTNFGEAISFYKRFLQKSKPNDSLRPWVKDELMRCANGLRLRHAPETSFVENAGTTINTQYSEFGVRTSPTTIDKIYFNSDRDDIARGKRPSGNVDIYRAELNQGRWTMPTPLPAHINSPGYDEVCGFSSDGQVLYYLTQDASQFKILTDTFSLEDGKSYKGIFHGPYAPAHGGTDLFFFNDTICLFASNMEGGFGGYDLYISVKTDGTWSRGINLGPAINTFYDERFPFLTRNGLTLYYSSNNLASMGGFDIFQSSFDPESFTWTHASNEGFPINSPSNDTYLVISPDGMSAFLTSDRKEGYGKEDIYSVFFKQPVGSHQQISPVPTFYHALLSRGQEISMTTTAAETPIPVKEYYLSHLFFDDNTDILSPQNIKKLDLLANLLLIYPRIIAELSCFELPSGPRTFNLYFSVKKAEKAADYLVRKGIERQRILLKGYGASFPLVIKPSGSTPNPVYQKLNQRLEIKLHDFENEPVLIHLENIPVPASIQDPAGTSFLAIRNQLYYSVQIASITQILQNQDLELVDGLFIEVDNAQGKYLYMAGMLPSFAEAEKMLSQMINIGFLDALVVPFLNGKRINTSAISMLTDEYPDLLVYLQSLKN